MLIEQAKQYDIDIAEQEFISVRSNWDKETFEKINGYSENGKHTIALTSANAVVALESYMHNADSYPVIDWEIFCLSGKTKQAITRLSNSIIIDTAGNAKLLAEKIIRHNVKEIIFFCGNKRRNELPAMLNDAGIRMHEVVVYETVETPQIVTSDLDAILFFSPSAVQSFFSVNNVKKNTVCFAIGKTTANTIAGFTDNKVIVSKSPTQEIMLASLNFYFQNTVEKGKSE